MFNTNASMLSKHLSPTIFGALYQETSAKGKFSFAEMIFPGVQTERTAVGVFPGGRESYVKYAALLDPIIADLHKVDCNQKFKGISMPKLKEMCPWKCIENSGDKKQTWSCAEQNMVDSVRIETVRNLTGH